jgi:predicted TIM-barrel fold metal-dependent hydrolase
MPFLLPTISYNLRKLLTLMSKRQLGWSGQHLGKDPVDLKDTPGLEADMTELSSSANTRCRSTGDYSMYCMYHNV